VERKQSRKGGNKKKKIRRNEGKNKRKGSRAEREERIKKKKIRRNKGKNKWIGSRAEREEGETTGRKLRIYKKGGGATRQIQGKVGTIKRMLLGGGGRGVGTR
jgi:hypothetical protein